MRRTPVLAPSALARRFHRPAALALALSVALVAPGCSDDDPVAERAEQATTVPPVSDACPEAEAFVSTLDELLAADVVALGTDGLRERIVAVSDAWEALRPAVAAANEAETEALVESVRDLRSVDLGNGSARAVVDYADALRSTRAAWEGLRAEIRDDLEDCDLASSAAAAGGS